MGETDQRQAVSLPCLVMKFGGTSMGSAERIRTAARLTMEQHALRPVAIVVSAMSKVTDLLLDTTRKAEAGDEAGVDENLVRLITQHETCCRELLPQGAALDSAVAGVRALIQEFARIVKGMMMLGERPVQSVDRAIAIGERLSALMMAAYLESQAIRAKAVNAAAVIATDTVFGNATPLMEETRERAAAVMGPLLAEHTLPVMTGFNGSTLDDRPTTLGRGGSDFSASILAAALDAGELWIWTDVDGIMTADPRLVPDARVLDALTYSEAAEMAYAGAKVLHPRTLAPLAEHKIAVWSKNSFAPEKPGTRIVPTVKAALGPRAVTSMKDVAMVSIEPASEPASLAISSAKLMAEAMHALDAAGVELLAITSSSYRQNFCFIIKESELAVALKQLEEEFAIELAHGYVKPPEVDTNVGMLAVVGEGMRGTPGLAGRIFTAISRHNINIIAIAQGSSELTIAIVVRRDGLEQAVRAVHEECGLGRLS